MLDAEDSNATQTGPIDACQLAALLSEAQRNGTTRSPPPHDRSTIGRRQGSLSPTLSPEPPEVAAAKYHLLVEESGRPLFPLDRLNNIASNPGIYQTLLRPWADDPDIPKPNDWKVFWKQLDDWGDFRRWQRDNRSNKFNGEEEFAMFREERRGDERSEGLGYHAERPEFEDWLKGVWDRGSREDRRRQHRRTRERADKKGFPDMSRQRGDG